MRYFAERPKHDILLCLSECEHNCIHSLPMALAVLMQLLRDSPTTPMIPFPGVRPVLPVMRWSVIVVPFAVSEFRLRKTTARHWATSLCCEEGSVCVETIRYQIALRNCQGNQICPTAGPTMSATALILFVHQLVSSDISTRG